MAPHLRTKQKDPGAFTEGVTSFPRDEHVGTSIENTVKICRLQMAGSPPTFAVVT